MASSTVFSDENLRNEILSVILGVAIKNDDGTREITANVLPIDDFLHFAIFERASYAERLSINQDNVFTSICLKGQSYADGLFINQKEFFDPQYDFDFTDLSTSDVCERGGEPYRRPCGWYRIALKVKGKYSDGDAWLGTGGWRSHSVPGEWPVSFHGTGLGGAEGIVEGYFKPGDGKVYGRGIYSTPDINIAESYAKTFKSKTTGKKYTVILQNRINPEEREVCQQEDYWLIPVSAGTSAEREKEIVERSIRPYGILIKDARD